MRAGTSLCTCLYTRTDSRKAGTFSAALKMDLPLLIRLAFRRSASPPPPPKKTHTQAKHVTAFCFGVPTLGFVAVSRSASEPGGSTTFRSRSNSSMLIHPARLCHRACVRACRQHITATG